MSDRAWYEVIVEGMKVSDHPTFDAAGIAATRYRGEVWIDACYVVGETGDGSYVRYDAHTNEQLGAGQL